MKTFLAIIVFVFGFTVFAAFPKAIFAAEKPQPPSPALLSIPSIKLTALIQPVGTEADGSMSVPLAPDTVGWYASGTLPGTFGSAVLDAHIYLAFKNLKNVKVGNPLYIAQSDGSWLRFVVTGTKTYAYQNVPLGKLFGANDKKYLNLITCAGKWLPAKGTYDRRLVVYATLAE